VPGFFDPTLKAMVEAAPGDWPVLVGQPRAPVEVIDADISTVSGAGDKVLCVQATPPYLLHLELQSGHDSAQVPRRLHLYNTCLDDRHDLPVRSVVMVLRPEADSPVLTGTYERTLAEEGPHLVFRYQVLRVWQMPADIFLAGGIGTLPLAPVSAVTEAELPGVIKRMKERLGGRRLRAKAERLWAATYLLLGLRYSAALAERLLEGVLAMEESTTYQAILARGRAEEARRILRLIGSDRFGEPPPSISTILDGITDVTRLENLGVRALHVENWQDLLDLPRATGRPRRRKRTS
jgi:hypothetical protein